MVAPFFSIPNIDGPASTRTGPAWRGGNDITPVLPADAFIVNLIGQAASELVRALGKANDQRPMLPTGVCMDQPVPVPSMRPKLMKRYCMLLYSIACLTAASLALPSTSCRHVLVGIQHSTSWNRSVPGLCATTLGHTRVSTVPVVVCNPERLCSTWHADTDAPRPAAGGAAHPATEAALAPSAC